MAGLINVAIRRRRASLIINVVALGLCGVSVAVAVRDGELSRRGDRAR
jgi:hypothetical protein